MTTYLYLYLFEDITRETCRKQQVTYKGIINEYEYQCDTMSGISDGSLHFHLNPANTFIDRSKVVYQLLYKENCKIKIYVNSTDKKRKHL